MDNHGPACQCDTCLGRITVWVQREDGMWQNRDATQEEINQGLTSGSEIPYSHEIHAP